MKKALIIGVSGQDGSYLSELLLEKGYIVHGMIRRSSSINTKRIDHLYKDPHEKDSNFFLHFGDLSDSSSLHKILERVEPDEVYNLGAQSHVKVSFEIPEYTGDVVGLGALRLFETIKEMGMRPKIYQAGSSEMYGKVVETPQDENTPFYPRSPYGCAKVFAHHLAINYREAHGLFIANGILFNHESPRRGESFVTRKITRAVCEIAKNKQKKLYLGNLDAKRDWGYAKDYVEAMWLMLQQQEPDDYVIATGETHTVREFVKLAFSFKSLDWREYVEIDRRYLRPTEVDILQGDASKAFAKLGWKPRTNFEELVQLMVSQEE